MEEEVVEEELMSLLKERCVPPSPILMSNPLVEGEMEKRMTTYKLVKFFSSNKKPGTGEMGTERKVEGEEGGRGYMSILWVERVMVKHRCNGKEGGRKVLAGPINGALTMLTSRS